MATITIVGAGMMGTALCWPLCDNGFDVHLVGTPLDEEIIASVTADRYHPTLEREVPAGVIPFSHAQLPLALQGAQVVASGVSSFGVPWFAETVGPHLQPEIPVVAVTKGLEDRLDGSLLTIPEATRRRLPGRLREHIHLNAIGGPCIAHELAVRRHTSVVFCGKDLQVLSTLKGYFQTPYYHIWLSTDVTGVEVCAALKNAYALGVGLAVGMMEKSGPDGLANMYNPQAALFAQGCLEIGRLLKLLGGGLDNLAWLPAPGDLYVTVFGGRTLRLGKLLGTGMPYSQARQELAGLTLESVEIITRVARALRILSQQGLAKKKDFPLLFHLESLIQQGAPVDIPWADFFIQDEDARVLL
jgi:glycerol-3-phosphate dehydrogenase (NAD(P)+)